jgi:hypothetical protein
VAVFGPSLKIFIKAYTNAPFAVVINEKYQDELEYNGKKVYFIRFDEIKVLEDLL